MTATQLFSKIMGLYFEKTGLDVKFLSLKIEIMFSFVSGKPTSTTPTTVPLQFSMTLKTRNWYVLATGLHMFFFILISVSR